MYRPTYGGRPMHEKPFEKFLNHVYTDVYIHTVVCMENPLKWFSIMSILTYAYTLYYARGSLWKGFQ